MFWKVTRSSLVPVKQEEKETETTALRRERKIFKRERTGFYLFILKSITLYKLLKKYI